MRRIVQLRDIDGVGIPNPPSEQDLRQLQSLRDNLNTYLVSRHITPAVVDNPISLLPTGRRLPAWWQALFRKLLGFP